MHLLKAEASKLSCWSCCFLRTYCSRSSAHIWLKKTSASGTIQDFAVFQKDRRWLDFFLKLPCFPSLVFLLLREYLLKRLVASWSCECLKPCVSPQTRSEREAEQPHKLPRRACATRARLPPPQHGGFETTAGFQSSCSLLHAHEAYGDVHQGSLSPAQCACSWP